MTVSQYANDFFVYHKELCQFLLSIKNTCQENNSTKIASIYLEIDLVDPLLLFSRLLKENQLNFYWENKANEDSIIAIDAVISKEISGVERFINAEKFIKKCIDNIDIFSPEKLSRIYPYFLCSFNFFSENFQYNYPFSPANIFLPKWQINMSKKHCKLIANFAVTPNVDISNLIGSLWEKIANLSPKAINPESDFGIKLNGGSYFF